MSYQSDLGSDPLIIDDGNAGRFVEQWRDEGRAFGMVPRDYQAAPFGSASKPMFQLEEIPRSKWADRIKELDETKGHPDDWRMAMDVPILDQNGFGYCWIYGVVGAMMTCAAMTGQPVPHLNPFPTAFRGKQGRNQGGWGEEALRYIDQWGVVEESLWPGHEAKMSNWDRQEVVANAKLTAAVERLELPRGQFSALMSALLGKYPRPVSMGLWWWGHLVYSSRAVALDGNRFGVKAPNSWKRSWGKDGCIIIEEAKAKADEQIMFQRVKPYLRAA